MITNRLYFGEYCRKEKPVCLNETKEKCKSCNTPKCKKHLKNDICQSCSLKPEFNVKCWHCDTRENLITNEEGKILPLCQNCLKKTRKVINRSSELPTLVK